METWFPVGHSMIIEPSRPIGRISMIATGSENELNCVARMKYTSMIATARASIRVPVVSAIWEAAVSPSPTSTPSGSSYLATMSSTAALMALLSPDSLSPVMVTVSF